MNVKELGDIAEVVMGQSPPGATVGREPVGVPLLNGPTEFGPYSPTPVQYTTDSRKRAHRGDILFCVRGSSTGRMNWADQQYAIGRGVAAIRHRRDQRLQPFVRAIIETGLADLLAQATGSTFPNVSMSQIASVECPDLPTEDQYFIADLLGSLDDKIDVNRGMAETLEQTARALFKSWFVDFDPVRGTTTVPDDIRRLFPDRLIDSRIGPVPAGWGVSTIGDEFQLTMGQSPPGSTYNEEGDGLPFFQGRTDFGTKFPRTRVYCSEPRRIAERGDMLLTVRAPVGDVNVALLRSCIGRGVAALCHQVSRAYGYSLLWSLRPSFDVFNAEGTVYGSVSKIDLARIPVLAPPTAVVEGFDEIVAPMFDEQEAVERESETLAKLRDVLLPKLISGEIRLPVEAAG